MSIEETIEQAVSRAIAPLHQEITELKQQLGFGYITRSEAQDKYSVPDWKVTGWINQGALKNYGTKKKHKYIEKEFASLCRPTRKPA